MEAAIELEKYNVLVVDDQPLFREGLTSLIKSWPRAGKISEVEGGLELLQILESSAWDIILLDLLMPSMDGLETLRQNLRAKQLLLGYVNLPNRSNR
jgi:two-component system nitrate/nitrite response regulator NarP